MSDILVWFNQKAIYKMKNYLPVTNHVSVIMDCNYFSLVFPPKFILMAIDLLL